MLPKTNINIIFIFIFSYVTTTKIVVENGIEISPLWDVSIPKIEISDGNFCNTSLTVDRTMIRLESGPILYSCTIRITSSLDLVYLSIDGFSKFSWDISNLKIYDGPNNSYPPINILRSGVISTAKTVTFQMNAPTDPYMKVFLQAVDEQPKCLYDVNACEAIVESERINKVYVWTTRNSMTMTCTWNISCPLTNFKIISMTTFPESAHCQDITVEYGNIYEDKCLSKNGIYETRKTDGQVFSHILIKTTIRPNSSYHFKYFFTLYSDMLHSKCPNDWFNCKNGKCIATELLCNGRNNCGNNHDEDTCASDTNTLNYSRIVTNILLLILIILIVTVSVLFYQHSLNRKSNKSVKYDNNCILIET